MDGLDYKQAYKQLVFQISELYKKHSYLLKSLEIDEDDKKLFAQLKTREADETLVIRSVSLLMRLMETYYGKPVILLMDEYDVPIAKASSNGYYSQMLSVIRGIMSTALKDNTSLKFAVITAMHCNIINFNFFLSSFIPDPPAKYQFLYSAIITTLVL